MGNNAKHSYQSNETSTSIKDYSTVNYITNITPKALSYSKIVKDKHNQIIVKNNLKFLTTKLYNTYFRNKDNNKDIDLKENKEKTNTASKTIEPMYSNTTNLTTISINAIRRTSTNLEKTRFLSKADVFLQENNYFIFSKLFLNEEKIYKLEEKGTSIINKSQFINEQVKNQIEQVIEYDSKNNIINYCEWSGDDVNTKIEEAFNYAGIINKLEDLNIYLRDSRYYIIFYSYTYIIT